ncbi:MAG: hypothetical protein MUC37_08995 [Hyphomicrobium sp.]|nr:hypothetical protein [Hyphomicrobium sp.]
MKRKLGVALMPSGAAMKWLSFASRGSSPNTLKHLSLQTSQVQAPSLQCGQEVFCFLEGEDGFAFIPWQSGMWSLLTACSTATFTGVAANAASGAIATQSATSTDEIFLKARKVHLAIVEVSAPE